MMESKWLTTVRTFADGVLQYGRDRYGPKPTPLLVDGVNTVTREPVVWKHDGEGWIVSNLACQQNLLRCLVGLTNLTDDARYRDAAAAATAHHFTHLRRSCGLLQWGGHRFVDLRTGGVVGEQDQHELKCVYPFYDLLWEVDQAVTAHYVEALWNAHVLDWQTLDMNRHGAYERPMGRLWQSEFAGAEPFFIGRGLTFINCASDLIYAASWLNTKTGHSAPLVWAKRLAEQYVRARDPRTGLGAYQFSQPRQERVPTAADPTWSEYGDRARRQLGPEFGDRALEGKVLDPGRGRIIYGQAAVAQLRMAERLGEAGREILDWQTSGLRAYARHAYDPATNLVRAMFTDGTPVTPGDVKRPGYYRPEVFEPQAANGQLLLAYALAWRLSGDEELWTAASHIARGLGLGCLANGVNERTQCQAPRVLLAVLEIHRATDDSRHLALARQIGRNIVAQRFCHGFFLPAPGLLNAPFDAVEALALLGLEAIERGDPSLVPEYPGGRGHICGPYDGLGRTNDGRAIWSVARNSAGSPAAETSEGTT